MQRHLVPVAPISDADGVLLLGFHLYRLEGWTLLSRTRSSWVRSTGWSPSRP